MGYKDIKSVCCVVMILCAVCGCSRSQPRIEGLFGERLGELPKAEPLADYVSKHIESGDVLLDWQREKRLAKPRTPIPGFDDSSVEYRVFLGEQGLIEGLSFLAFENGKGGERRFHDDVNRVLDAVEGKFGTDYWAGSEGASQMKRYFNEDAVFQIHTAPSLFNMECWTLSSFVCNLASRLQSLPLMYDVDDEKDFQVFKKIHKRDGYEVLQWTDADSWQEMRGRLRRGLQASFGVCPLSVRIAIEDEIKRLVEERDFVSCAADSKGEKQVVGLFGERMGMKIQAKDICETNEVVYLEEPRVPFLGFLRGATCVVSDESARYKIQLGKDGKIECLEFSLSTRQCPTNLFRKAERRMYGKIREKLGEPRYGVRFDVAGETYYFGREYVLVIMHAEALMNIKCKLTGDFIDAVVMPYSVIRTCFNVKEDDLRKELRSELEWCRRYYLHDMKEVMPLDDKEMDVLKNFFKTVRAKYKSVDEYENQFIKTVKKEYPSFVADQILTRKKETDKEKRKRADYL